MEKSAVDTTAALAEKAMLILLGGVVVALAMLDLTPHRCPTVKPAARARLKKTASHVYILNTEGDVAAARLDRMAGGDVWVERAE